MNNLEFAKAMVRYEELHKELKALEAQITDHVMGLEQTQEIGNVKARYSKGRTSYNYEMITSDYPLDTLKPYIAKHSKMIEKIDWRSICKELDYDPPIANEPTPYVKVEVKDG